MPVPSVTYAKQLTAQAEAYAATIGAERAYFIDAASTYPYDITAITNQVNSRVVDVDFEGIVFSDNEAVIRYTALEGPSSDGTYQAVRTNDQNIGNLLATLRPSAYIGSYPTYTTHESAGVELTANWQNGCANYGVGYSTFDVIIPEIYQRDEALTDLEAATNWAANAAFIVAGVASQAPLATVMAILNFRWLAGSPSVGQDIPEARMRGVLQALVDEGITRFMYWSTGTADAQKESDDLTLLYEYASQTTPGRFVVGPYEVAGIQMNAVGGTAGQGTRIGGSAGQLAHVGSSAGQLGNAGGEAGQLAAVGGSAGQGVGQ